MKIKLLFLLLFGFGAASAQIANIPNPIFKNALVNQDYIAKDSEGNNLVIDANDDGEIQVSEAMAVWQLGFPYGLTLNNLDGINEFENLRILGCSSTGLSTLTIQDLHHLEELNCSGNQLISLTLTDLESLMILNANENLLTSLNMIGLTSLEHLSLYQNNLTTFDYSGCPNLKYLLLEDNSFTSITISGLNFLETIIINNTTSLTSATFSNLPSLVELQAAFCWLHSLELQNLLALQTLYAGPGTFSSLDLSSCPSLINVFVESSDLYYLNLKNGPGIIESLSVGSNWQLSHVCVDEDELATVSAMLQVTEPPIYYTTDCEGNSSYNVIKGTLKFDGNDNGCDGADSNVYWRKIKIDNGASIRTLYLDDQGFYNHSTLTGSYTVTAEPVNEWFTMAPEFASVSFSDVNATTSINNFCMNAVGEHYDAEVIIVPLLPARPGFDATYEIIYTNNGTQSISGNIALNYDEPFIDFISSVPAPESSSTGMISWSFTDLQPAEVRKIPLTYNINGPMETPAVNLDDVLNYTATISIDEEDEILDNNIMGIKQIVIGSLDPNDITCLQGNIVAPERIGEYLHYNINFENIGTAAATFVIVENYINPQQFDIDTIGILGSSHAMTATVEGNKITFRFDGINLGSNEKGNVVYKIKTLETLEENTTVMQEANIFFDYNFPIVTNQAETIFARLNNKDFINNSNIKIHPNPTTGFVNILSQEPFQSMRLYDLQGRLLQNAPLNNTTYALDISGHPAGLYVLEIKTEAGVKIEKIVKK